MADGSSETVVLGHGFELDCSFPSVDSVSVRIRFHRFRLWSLRFDANTGLRNHRVNLGLIELSLAVEGDMFRGEAVWRLRLAVRSIPSRPWRSLISTGDRVMLSFDPCLGEVAGQTAVRLPEVDDPIFGKSQTCTPTVLRLHVEERQRDLCHVGRIVKERMFPAHPPLVINTVGSPSLPPGLQLKKTGDISGGPTSTGTYTFIVEMTDTKTAALPHTDNIARKVLSITI